MNKSAVDIYYDYMVKQIIYLKEIPKKTIPAEPLKEWSYDSQFGNIEIRAMINGPIDKDKYFEQDLRVLFYLRDPYISWEDWEEDELRGGQNQSVEYKDTKWNDVKNKTYKGLIKFAFYLIRFLSDKHVLDGDFEGNEEEGMASFQNHFCILNACPFPHVGNTKADPSRCINWVRKNSEIYGQFNSFFNPTIIIGAEVFDPEWNEDTKQHEMFSLNREGVLYPDKSAKIADSHYLIAAQTRPTYLMSDGNIYINTYHPLKFNPYETAFIIAKLFHMHKTGELTSQWTSQ